MSLNRIILVLFLAKCVCPELLQVHVLFATNGYIPPSYSGDIYAKLPYFKLFAGTLTEKGELSSYHLGRQLHKRYKDFLPKIYSTNISESFSTNSKAAQASLQCLHLGLFPPTNEQTFIENLDWQPIPYKILKEHKDEFLSALQFCSESWNLPNDQNCKQLSNLLTLQTGHKVTKNEDIFRIYKRIKYQIENKLDLPKWIDEDVFEYMEICSEAYLEQLIQLRVNIASGKLLQKITHLAQDKQNNVLLPPDRKVFIYSGDIYNVPLMLTALSRTLKVENDEFMTILEADIASLVFELHYIDGIIGFKLFYQFSEDLNETEINMFQALNTFVSLEEFILKTRNVYDPKVECF